MYDSYEAVTVEQACEIYEDTEWPVLCDGDLKHCYLGTTEELA